MDKYDSMTNRDMEVQTVHEMEAKQDFSIVATYAPSRIRTILSAGIKRRTAVTNERTAKDRSMCKKHRRRNIAANDRQLRNGHKA